MPGPVSAETTKLTIFELLQGFGAFLLLCLVVAGFLASCIEKNSRTQADIDAANAAAAAYRQARFDESVDRCFESAVVLPKAKLARLPVTRQCRNDSFDQSKIVEAALNRLVQVHHSIGTGYVCFDGWPNNHCEYQLHLP